MGHKSKIEWTDASWTPIRARPRSGEKLVGDPGWKSALPGGRPGWYCEHVSDGCRNCYAEAMNRRLGTAIDFVRQNRDRVEIFLDEEMLLAPLRWKKPRMIFVCSMTDAFADFVKDEWLDKIFAVMALCPQHTFQVLTKRAERMRGYLVAENVQRRILDSAFFEGDIQYAVGIERLDELSENIRWLDIADEPLPRGFKQWPLPNVWLGVSTERQHEADERIPFLLQTPAAVRFISAEPLIGPINLMRLGKNFGGRNALTGLLEVGMGTLLRDPLPGLDWVIVGGESGPNSRPFHIEWADALVEQCRAAGVPCFVKQFGAMPMSGGYPLELHDRKGGDEAEWPSRLNVREFPRASAPRSPVVTQPSNAEAVVP